MRIVFTTFFYSSSVSCFPSARGWLSNTFLYIYEKHKPIPAKWRHGVFWRLKSFCVPPYNFYGAFLMSNVSGKSKEEWEKKGEVRKEPPGINKSLQ